jgi:hypothetical protein
MPNVYYRTQQIDDVEAFGGFEVRRALPAPKWQMIGSRVKQMLDGEEAQ